MAKSREMAHQLLGDALHESRGRSLAVAKQRTERGTGLRN